MDGSAIKSHGNPGRGRTGYLSLLWNFLGLGNGVARFKNRGNSDSVNPRVCLKLQTNPGRESHAEKYAETYLHMLRE